MIRLEDRIADLCGASVATLSPVGGGDFATAYRAELADGSTVFAKTHRSPPPGFFSTEAAGLTWLAEADAINVATVVGVTDDDPACLVLEWIDEGSTRSAETESAFGESLAELHRCGAEVFGRVDGRTTGSQALPNVPCDNWVEFYRDRRLGPLADIAARRNVLPAQTIDDVLAVANRLADYGAVDEAPARLHGDLWAGNRIVDARGQSWLIDPAAHGGHREFDLAMMRLFGGFGPEAFDAYHRSYPLADGWVDRVSLHQLAPLIVHAIKFGGGYVGAVDDALAGLA